MTSSRKRTEGNVGIPDQPGGANTELTHVPPTATGCRFHTPDLPAKGEQTITLDEYRAWEAHQ